MTRIWIALVALLPSPALAVDCFAEGNAAYRAGRYSAARAAFAAMREAPECRSDPLLLLNLARTAQALVDRGAEPQLACTAAQEYAAFLRSGPDETLAGVAHEGRAVMTRRCVSTTAGADRTEAWIWTGAAVGTLVLGGVFNGLARGAASDGAAAADDQRAAMDLPAYNAAKSSADDAYDSAESYALTSYALFGVGVALAGVATWRWLSVDGGPLAVAPTGNGLALVGRW